MSYDSRFPLLTGVSMHARSACSNAMQPCTLYPDEAQHPSIEVMMPMHGLSSFWFGRRTRRLCSGGNLIGVIFVDNPFGAMVCAACGCSNRVWQGGDGVTVLDGVAESREMRVCGLRNFKVLALQLLCA